MNIAEFFFAFHWCLTNGVLCTLSVQCSCIWHEWTWIIAINTMGFMLVICLKDTLDFKLYCLTWWCVECLVRPFFWLSWKDGWGKEVWKVCQIHCIAVITWLTLLLNGIARMHFCIFVFYAFMLIFYFILFYFVMAD